MLGQSKSRWCSTCTTHWPLQHPSCPDCGATTQGSGVTPIPKDQYDRKMAFIRCKRGELAIPPAGSIEEFEADWEAAERVAKATGLDVYEVLVSQRHKRAAA